MAQDILVDADLKAGRALVEALDRTGFPVSAAFWYFEPQREIWRLVLATPRYENLRDATLQIVDVIRTDRAKYPDSARISVRRPDDPLVSGFSKRVHVDDLNWVRFPGGIVGNEFVEDAYIYRVAA